jgi:hypothetical protein
MPKTLFALSSEGRRRGAIGIAALVLALGALVLLWTRPAGELVTGDAAVATARDLENREAMASDAPAEPEAPEHSAPPAQAEVKRVAVAVPRATGDPQVEGRCVDETGHGLPGCEIALRALHTANGPAVPAQFTRGDGSFSFAVPANVSFELRLEAPLRAALVGTTGRLQDGDRLALGDFVLHRGCTVTAAVVDETGVPREGVEVILRHDPVGAFAAAFHPDRLVRASTDPAGVARFPPVMAGHWLVSLSANYVEGPRQLDLRAGCESAIELRIQRPPGDRITGRVLDQLGAPVKGAVVTGVTQEGAGAVDFAGEDGAFTLTRRDRASDAPVTLRVRATGCEDFVRAEPVAWGTKGLDLLVVRGAGLSVHVRDAQGRDVEDFNLRVFSPTTVDYGELRPRSHGHHPGGLASAAGVTTGPQVILVRCAHEALVQAGLAHVTTHGAPMRVEIAVDRRIERAIRVQSADGEPIAGATVELLLPLDDHPIHAGTPGIELDRLIYFRGRHPALRHEVERTSADGRAVVAGHPTARYTARVAADGWCTVVADVALSALPDPWIVRLPRGARVEGRLEPLAIARALHALLIGPREPQRSRPSWQVKNARREARAPLFVALVREQDGAREEHPQVATPDEDGRFALAGVAPGTWQVVLHWSWPTPMPSGPELHGEQTTLASVVVGGEGEVCEVTVPLQPLELGVLTGRVLYRGEPRLGLLELVPVGGGPRRLAWGDHDGAFLVALPAGVWRCALRIYTRMEAPTRGAPLQRFGRSGPDEVSAEGTATVVTHGSTEATWSVDDGVLRLRALAADGGPAGDTRLRLEREDDRAPAIEIETDSAGMVERTLSAGRYRILLPAPAGSAGGEATQLGEVAVPADGSVVTAEVRLPAPVEPR